MNKNDKKIIILSIIIIVFLIAMRIALAPLTAGDEFINYYNTLKIFNGEKMWEDVNIITTPLIYLLGCAIFKICGTKFVIYRIINFFVNIIFFMLIYKTFRNLEINKKSSLIYTAILEIPIISYVILWGLTYNVVAIVFCLIGINLSIKKPKYYNLKQGLIIFLVLFTKHNIGLYYLIAQILIELLVNRKLTNILKQLIIVILGLGLFVIILHKVNLLNSFIDMAFIGVSSFTSNIEIAKLPVMVTCGSIILLSILIFIKKYDTEKKENILILSIMGIMLLFMAFPIADDWHTILASIVIYIELIYVLDFDGIKLNNNKILIFIDAYLILFVCLNIFYNVYSVKKGVMKFEQDKQSSFYLSFIRNPNRIDKIEEFIKSKNGKVLVVSPEAGIYNLDLNLESKSFFDEPFNGNLGSNQLDKMKEKLKNYEDYYILVHTKKAYIQEIDEFRDYINENYKKILEIENFSVYIKQYDI